ncbi:MAG: helix-turn-helix transcriptional regulator [Rhizomicrobium sp.]
MNQKVRLLVSKKELKSVCGIPYSPQHIARLEAAGKFPKRVRLGANRVAWLMAELEQWVEQKASSRAALAAVLSCKSSHL